MTILQHSIAQAAAAASGYQIARSLRVNKDDTAQLTRSVTSAGNRRTHTYSIWVKRTRLGGTEQTLLCAPRASGESGELYSDKLIFNNSDNLVYYARDTTDANLISSRVFRDLSAFYHILLVVDTTQATASNRVKLYVNNEQITAFSTANYPAQNYQSRINNVFSHTIGTYNNGTTSGLDAVISDIRFIDGQALDPTSFGQLDANTGVWMPKTYSGTYGANGFWLKLDDNSNNTAATLGKDSSGNSNNWTPNNFSVIAGVGNDSLVDTPTNYGTDTGAGGEVRGNYCTWNPLSQSNQTLSNGNLQTTNGANQGRVNGTLAVSSGKWYFEGVVTATTNVYSEMGIGQNDITTQEVGQDALSYGYIFESGLRINNNVTAAYGSALAVNDVFMCAFDLDNNKVWFGKNGTWFGSGNPVTGANQSYSITAGTYKPIARAYSSTMHANFGQRPFAYTAPSGFKALCTQNLPTPAIGATSSTLANKNFDINLYTGTNTTLAITNSGAFQPDLVWIKSRSNAVAAGIIDAVRGVRNNLVPSGTVAETLEAAGKSLTAFNANGFTLGTDNAGSSSVNASGYTYAAWQFKGGNGTVSNTSGSITSTVSANPTAGVSVVTYTGNNTAGATVGHGLGVAPKMIIAKSRGIENWGVYHHVLGATNGLLLNTTGGSISAAWWNSAIPTSSVFSLSSSSGITNGNAVNYVAYCFAEVAGFSKFGSYTGNGSSTADGPFVYCGFRPRYVMIKRTDTTSNWSIYDTARDTYNDSSALLLWANLSNAETPLARDIDILSNGFKCRSNDSDTNTLNGTYIFAAFAEAPFNYARAR
jgi:hypothetical protein